MLVGEIFRHRRIGHVAFYHARTAHTTERIGSGVLAHAGGAGAHAGPFGQVVGQVEIQGAEAALDEVERQRGGGNAGGGIGGGGIDGQGQGGGGTVHHFGDGDGGAIARGAGGLGDDFATVDFEWIAHFVSANHGIVGAGHVSLKRGRHLLERLALPGNVRNLVIVLTLG